MPTPPNRPACFPCLTAQSSLPPAYTPRHTPGTALLCYVTPKEHLGLPNRDDVKVGLGGAPADSELGLGQM